MQQRFWKKKTLLLSIIISLSSNTSIAGELSSETQSKLIEVKVKSMPLGDALQKIATQFGKQIVFISDIAEGVSAPSFSGLYSEKDALNKLLENTHLTYRYINANTIAIEKSKNDSIEVSPESNDVDSQSQALEENGLNSEFTNNSIETIVITAQRRVQNIQDVPLAITAFSGSSLERSGISGLSDVARLTPGFTVSSFSASEPIIAIRGANSTFSQAGTSKPVGVFVDDVYISRNTAAAFELYDLDQVSILRGPQGTLFGRNVTGGAIVINTQRPSLDDSIIKAEINIGNYGAKEIRALVSAPLSDDWAGKLSGSIRQRDGFGEDRLINSEQTNLDSVNVRGQLLYQPSDEFDALLTLDYSDDMNHGRTISTSTPASANDGDIRTSEHGVEQEYERDSLGVSLHLNWHLDSGDVTSISAYRNSDSLDEYSMSPTSFTLLPSFNPFFPFQDVRKNIDTPDTLSQELRFVSKQNGMFSYVAGLYYFDDEVSRQASTMRLAGVSGNLILDQTFDQNVQTESYAVYGDFDWDFSEQWRLTLGGRYTAEEKTAQVNYFNNNPTRNYQSGYFTEDWSEFTPRLVLNWQPYDDLTLYGSYTEGFTSGGFNTEEDNVDVVGRPFDPETLNAYELGLKSDFFNNNIRANLTLFRQEYKDKQEGYLDPNFNFVIVNAAEATMNGAEFEFKWVINDNFSYNGSYAYLDAKYDDFVFNTINDGVDDRSGNFLPTAPKNSLHSGLDFYYVTESGLIDANISYTWQNDYYTGSDNRDTFLIDSYELLNAHISYETDSAWKFTLWAKNIADKDYVLIRSDFSAGGIGESYGAPRTFGIKVSKVFE
jgi:iron complex outermembrane receptor protein